VRRISAALIAGLIAVGLFAPASLAATAKPANAVPRVVFIVGPTGAKTDGLRSQARAAAAIARRYTPDVIELYSPDATWPAVKQALTGASLVVYMGHGNGWPSTYRDALYPPSQNGFGLNPTAGGGDSAHQYFGEASIEQVNLAKNAVVLLNHLCYASGNTEPGLPEGTLDQARLRVDNYAAGFIAAGASAVIAEAWSSPSYFVHSILGGGRSIQSAWQTSPSANGHRLAFDSDRSPGYIAQMDPETASSGFTRSIVMKAGLAPKDILAGAAGSAAGAESPSAAILPIEPSLMATGLRLGAPDIQTLPSAGTAGRVDMLIRIKDREKLPTGVQASARWDPIEVMTAPAVQPDAPDSLDAADPTGATDRIEAPDETLDLVVPERLGDVVAPVGVSFGPTVMMVPVTLPTVPGRYRLTITLHDAEGVAYDAATQALTPPLIVRVTGDFDGAILAAPTAELAAGADVRFGLRVVNLGVAEWGHKAVKNAADFLDKKTPDQVAHVVGRWIPLSAGAVIPTGPGAAGAEAALPVGLASGKSANAVLALVAPTAPGDYLLLLDIVTPERGSLVASGAEPTLVRVTVTAAP
jgi:hypothetical protein